MMINRLKRAFTALHPFRPTADRPAEDVAARPFAATAEVVSPHYRPSAPPPDRPTPPPCKHPRWRTVRKTMFVRTIACRSCGLTKAVAR